MKLVSLKNIAKLVQQATVKNQTPADEFENYLKQSIVMMERKNQRAPSKTYKPSSMGGCLRRVYFEVEGAPVDGDPTINIEAVGMAESGTDRHERIQQAVISMKEFGMDCEWIDVEEYLKQYPQPGTRVIERKGNEFKLRNDILNMSFLCDGIIKFGGRYYILEIKTEVSFKWNPRQDAEDKHKSQASCYSSCLGIDDIMFVYEQRDMCAKKYYHISITEEDKIERVIHVISTVEEHRRVGTVPEKTEDKKECTYCPFKGECKKW